jgi:hypothetical protein
LLKTPINRLQFASQAAAFTARIFGLNVSVRFSPHCNDLVFQIKRREPLDCAFDLDLAFDLFPAAHSMAVIDPPR